MESKEKAVIKKECHSRMSLLGIPTIDIQSGEDPRLQTSGMTKNGITTRGFTLIELLIVVLIIGILAAIALPQYQIALAKARVTAYLPMVESLVTAQEMYYLEHGKYASALDQLTIPLPINCNHAGAKNLWKCDTYFQLDFSIVDGSMDKVRGFILNYCPKNNSSYYSCYNKRDFALRFPFQHPYNKNFGPRACYSYGKSRLGKQVCQSLHLAD